jgi:hypothetical protein
VSGPPFENEAHAGERDHLVLGATLDIVMIDGQSKNEESSLLSVVALLADIPAVNLIRGHVGTVVEPLDEKTVLVEFTDDHGRAYAIAPCPRSQLLALRYAPQAL